MQAARDRADQHGIFFVVWPEEKSQESQVTLPSPQHPQEHNSSLMETAASSSSSQDTSTISRDASTSRRYTDSISPPIQSPESEYLYLSSKQHAVPSPAAVDPLKSYSPMQPFRTGTTGHQMIALPAPAIVSLAAESQQVLLATEQPTSILNHPPEQRDHSILFSPAHKQLLQMNSPLLTGVPTVPQRQDVENLRKIGYFAEQAALNLQNILQTTHKYQPVSKLTSHSNPEIDQQSDSNSLSSPAAKRFCPSNTVIPGACLECEVKMAEIQILRKKIHTLQEQVNSRTDRVFPSPLLTSASMESPRVQQVTVKQERTRLPLHLPTHHPETPFPVEPQTTNARGRKSLDKQSPAPLHTPPMENQSVANGNELSELVSGSGVFVLTQSLMEARKDARSGTQLARKLMDVFWDKDTLAKSTLTPRSKFQYQQLDPKIIKAIEVFCLQYDSSVHSKDIHATMTDKCCQARSRIRTLNPESLTESTKTQNGPFHS
ncbi:uncharacterized protein LOC135333725 [Halichondria panicea]|uniref:uncharacterized protein LOC135333725 n=1 Tax=Halichondria panicea TaxID=6063 RepID=UPI00312B868A